MAGKQRKSSPLKTEDHSPLPLIELDETSICFLIDDLYRITYINRVPQGTSVEQVIGTSCLDYVPAQYHSTVTEAVKRSARTRLPATYAIPARGENGSVVWHSSQVLMLPLDQNAHATLIITRDRSIDMNMMLELRQQASLIDLAHDAIIVRDQQDRVQFWNKGAEETYGWPATEAYGKITHEILQTKFPRPLVELTEIMRQSGRWEGELIHSCSDGRIITVASRWAIYRNEDGSEVGVMEINRDITARKIAEERLREHEKQLGMALAGSDLAYWDWNLADHRVAAGSIWTSILGFSVDELGDAEEHWFSLVHPLDLANARQCIEAHLAGDTERYSIEHRMRHKSGHWVRLEINGKVTERDMDGTPRRMVGTARDLTQQDRLGSEGLQLLKRVEELIRESVLPKTASKVNNAAYESLTKRERQILSLIAKGNTSAEIAKQLNVSTNTINVHRHKLMTKLDLHSTAEVIRFAVDLNIDI